VEITKDTLISDLFDSYPQAAAVFVKNNLCCIACSERLFDSLEKAAINHNFDLGQLMEDVRNAIK
jgi:hybrid cluster-associated redox disulfide protein